jgi:protein-L-isoaspartate(D-aspartate) O-methyltransferase
MIPIELRRQAYAEEIEAVADLTTPGLVAALATVPRERFLPAGPWTVRGEVAPERPRRTPDADPGRVYHNISVAIDPARQLFNGAPSTVASFIDALVLVRGTRVLHVGAGTGYYSAVMGKVVGESGRVVAVEADAALADQAQQNLREMPWVEVRHAAPDERFDAILVNAGVTHPQPAWLDALAIGGRMMLPLTVTMPAMGHLGKGFMTFLRKIDGATFDARAQTLTMIYSAVGLRDERLNETLGKAMMRTPFPPFTRLRRDPHDEGAGCWFHATEFCFSMG